MPVNASLELGYDFEQSDLIPTDYMKLTNSPVVANQCSSSESYWLTPQIGNLVKLRAPRDVCIKIEWFFIKIHIHF